MKIIGGLQQKSRAEIVWLRGGRRRIPPSISNATPLQWYRSPHQPHFDGGLDSPTDHNQVEDDASGSASSSDSRNSPPPPHPWCCNVDGVDTTLRLRPPGNIIATDKQERSPEKRGKRPADAFAVAVADDQDQKKRRTRDSIIDQERYRLTCDLDHAEVDTTLRLSTYLSRNSSLPPYVAPTVPTAPPPRWLLPGFLDGVDDDEVDTTLSLRPPGTTSKKSRTPKAKRTRESPCKKKCSAIDDENQRPLIPIEEIPRLHEALISRGGEQPVFLYRKKLEESDVKESQNRVLVTRRERLMEFLSVEEAAAADGGRRGLRIVGVDGGGNVYEKLKVSRWGKVTVINSDWGRVVAANHGKRGDVVEIWGYRESGRACLAFNFRRERDIHGADAAAASTSSSHPID